MSFGKLGVNFRQMVPRLVGSALLLLKAREACSGAQLPSQRSLPLGPFQGIVEKSLGMRSCAGSNACQYDLTFDTQQFGNIPAVFVPFRLLKRFRDCRHGATGIAGT